MRVLARVSRTGAGGHPPPGVSVGEINRPAGFRVSRLTRDRDLLREGYRMGLAAAKDLPISGEAAFTTG